jgi:hypothetical protein
MSTMLRRLAVLAAGFVFGWIPPEAQVMLIDPLRTSDPPRSGEAGVPRRRRHVPRTHRRPRRRPPA